MNDAVTGAPAVSPARGSRWLLGAAIFNLVVPNGIFIRWYLTQDHSIAAVLQNHLAAAFITEAMLLLVLFAVHIARVPAGWLGWKWFVALSFVGGLGFSVPLYWWMRGGMAESWRSPHPPEMLGL
jgi:hypothetical protein